MHRLDILRVILIPFHLPYILCPTFRVQINADTDRPDLLRLQARPCGSTPPDSGEGERGAEAKAKTDAVAEERAEANAKANAEAKAEGASAGRGGIPGPTGNSAKSRGPATGAFDLRRGRKKPSERDAKAL